MREADTKSKQHQAQAITVTRSLDKGSNVTVIKFRIPQQTGASNIKNCESQSCSPDIVNLHDKEQENTILFKDGSRSHLELNNSSIRNILSPNESQIDPISGIYYGPQSSDRQSPAVDLMLIHDTVGAEVNMLPICQTEDCDKSEKCAALTKEKNGLVENTSSVSNNKQSGKSCDIQTEKRKVAETDSSINTNDRVVDNFVPKLPCLPSRTGILTKEDRVYTFTHAFSDKIHPLMETSSEEEDICNDSSLNYVQQRTVENIFSNCAYTVDQSPENPAPSYSEEVSLSQTSNDFHPIILDVRGGYCEMETDDSNESKSLTNSETSVGHLSEIGPGKSKHSTNVAENVESFPKSASQLLQGMLQHAVSASPTQKSSKNKIVEPTNIYSAAENETLNLMFPLTETASRANKTFSSKRSASFLTENDQNNSRLNSTATVSSRLPDQPVSSSGRLSLTARSKAPQREIITFPVGSKSQSSNSSHVLSNILISNGKAYSCVFVQDSNKAKKTKVALLIPQSSLTGVGNVASSASSGLPKTPVTDSQTIVKNIRSSQTCTASSSPAEFSANTSFVDIISKLVTNTVNSFRVQGKDLIDSNLLKITPPKENALSQNTVYCSFCGEGYYDKEGLHFHFERTVFHLLFHCSHCKHKIVFYNKCSLFMHLKSETDNLMLNYSDILCLKNYEFDGSESPILETEHANSASGTPAAYANSASEAPAAYADSASEASASSLCITDITCSSLPVGTPVEEVVSSKSEDHCTASAPLASSSSNDQLCNTSRCPTCFQIFPDLTAHLCPELPVKYLCPSCGMFLPSSCAREAHIKIHLGVVKNISCPECGKGDFKMTPEIEDVRSVFDHLDSCKHFNRILGIKCFCNEELSNVNQLEKHFVDKHCRTLFKCHSCLLAFTQHDHFVGHVNKVHKTKGTDTKASVLCLCCQQIVKSVVTLREHVDQHVEQMQNNSVFKWKCFICTKCFVSKEDLNKHLELDHPHKPKRCTICYSLFCSRKNLVEHIIQKKCSRYLTPKLNYCVDQHPEVPEQAAECVDLNMLFEIKQVASKVLGYVEVVSPINSNHLTSIVPKPAPLSSQSAANRNINRPKQNSLPIICPAQPVTQQRQELTGVSLSDKQSVTDKVLSEPSNITISGDCNPVPGKSMSMSALLNQCVVCKKLIESTKLTAHLKLHQSQGVIICFHCQRRNFITMEEALEHSDMCGHERFISLESQNSLRSDSSRTEEVTVEADGGDRQPDLESNGQQQVESDGKNMEGHSVFPCLLCGLAFQSLSSREEHVSRSHDGTRIVYHCGICRKRGKAQVFTKKVLATRHITKKHRIVNMDTVNRLIRTEEQNVSSGQKLPTSEPAKGEDEGASVPKRLRVAGEGDYMCGKCGFSCSKSEEFSQHILFHNSKQEPQCPECGLCFTILHALKRHLLAVHKIKAVEDYMKEKNIAEPDLEEEFDMLPEVHLHNKSQTKSLDLISDKSNTLSKRSPSNPLECNVCYKVFDIEANLKTHMRNHGMAFIRSKRHKL